VGWLRTIRKLEGKMADFHAEDDILGQIATIYLAKSIKKAKATLRMGKIWQLN
jgi:hypothetical protein